MFFKVASGLPLSPNEQVKCTRGVAKIARGICSQHNQFTIHQKMMRTLFTVCYVATRSYLISILQALSVCFFFSLNDSVGKEGKKESKRAWAGAFFESRKVENSSWRRGGPLNLFATFLSSQKSWARWPCRTTVFVFKDKDTGNNFLSCINKRCFCSRWSLSTLEWSNILFCISTPFAFSLLSSLRFPGIESVKVVYKMATSPEKGWGGRLGLIDLVLIARLEHKFRK